MNKLVSNWMADLNARFNNTYKFVLQLAILDNCEKGTLSYRDIAEFFVERYWDNVVTYNLNESIDINRAPVFHKSIKLLAEKHGLGGLYYRQAIKVIPDLNSQVISGLGERYSTTLQNPISRLQDDSNAVRTGSGSPCGTGWLYAWDSTSEVITFNASLVEDIILNKKLLKTLSVFNWAMFVEKYNQTPSVINKLLNKKGSRNIKKSHREAIITESLGVCFYCHQSAERIEIDHFIPFAFLFENPLWDLVCSCSSCNSGTGGKFEKLPPKRFLENLFKRNRKLLVSQPDLISGYESLEKLEEHIRKFYNSCLNAGFRHWDKT